jgi:glucosamine-6-phosphate deaminase
MQILLVETESFNHVGAALIASIIRAKPNANVVIATGNTPMGVYSELANLKARGELDCLSLRVFQLDAYANVPLDDPRSLQGWSRRSFLEPLQIPEANFTPLIGYSDDHEAACETYHQAVVNAGGYDLAILGLGPNGHLGFNEPPCTEKDRTRVITLTEESLVSNAVYLGGRENVPTHALTAGMDLLLAAKQILLLVTGAHKQTILQKTLYGAVTPSVPSSYLQRVKHVTVLADKAALPK